MGVLLELIVSGLATGAMYSLMAVGFGLIYNATRVFHIAHGATFVLGGYLFFTAYSIWGWHLIAAYLFSIAGCAAYGILLEAAIYNPLRKKSASIVMTLISSLGILIITENVLSLIFGPDTHSVYTGTLPTVELAGSFRLTVTDLVAFALTAIVFLALFLVLTRTKVGKMIRAISDNPQMSTIVGIHLNKVYSAARDEGFEAGRRHSGRAGRRRRMRASA